jgi:hypothetical protein
MPLFGPPSIDKMRERRDTDGLKKALYNDKYTAAQHHEAAWTLSHLEEQRAIPILVEYYISQPANFLTGRPGLLAVLLTLAEPGIQAVVDLHRRGSPHVVDSLAAICLDPKRYSLIHEIFKPAMEAIRRIGPQAENVLMETCLRRENEHLSEKLIERLGQECNQLNFDLLISLLTSGTRNDRRRAATALLAWYQAGSLDTAQKDTLLQRRERIGAKHTDQSTRHTDIPKRVQHSDIPDKCYLGDHVDIPAQDHTDSTHTDEGGLDLTFPL